MKIDSHQHFWNYNAERDNWIDESMSVIKKDFFPEDLYPILKKNNIHGCVAIQANQSEEETHFLLDLAKQYSFIKGVVGWIDLCNKNVEKRIAYFNENKLLKGFRHIVQTEKEDFLLRKEFQNGLRQLGDFKLTYDLLILPNQLNAAIKLVSLFPDQIFILDHLAKPKISEPLESNWVNHIKILATHSNVMCKISGMVTETEKFKWNQTDFIPFLDTITNAFGVDRLLFGSDWPVCLLAASYDEVIKINNEYFKNFSKEERDKIFGENAQRIYNLD